MRTVCKRTNAETSFIITDVDPVYHQTVRNLMYLPMEEGFAKIYPGGTPDLDLIYGNFSKYAEPMILQAAGAMPIPWELALSSFLDKIEGESINWWLAGSAALAVRGMAIIPHDFDLIVDDESARRLGAILNDYLIEPVHPVRNWFCNWWGRAFLHARFEWVGGVDQRADRPMISDFGPTAAGRLEKLEWKGRTIFVPPLDLQLEVSRRRGLSERAAQIEKLMGSKSNC